MNQLIVALCFSALSFSAFAQTSNIDELKQQISALALENISNVESREVVRKQLDSLISELAQVAGPVTEQTWVQFAPGGWQQIWSDERDNSPPGAPAQDLTQIYQFISAEGWGFNFGERKVSADQSMTFALAVVGSISGNQQTTEITQAFFRPSGLSKGESLADLSIALRSRGRSGFDPREAGRFPNGPIGAKGFLNIQFLDHDLKIGYSPNVFTGQLELFVLRRNDFVVK